MYAPRIYALLLQKNVLLLTSGEMIVGTMAGIAFCMNLHTNIIDRKV